MSRLTTEIANVNREILKKKGSQRASKRARS